MLWGVFLSLCLFGLVTAITPGPNNFMLANSGAQFGMTRTLHHLLGIRLGIGGIILLSAAGVSLLVQTYPVLYQALKYLGVLYMSYLALKLLLAAGGIKLKEAAKPLSLAQATFFQLANPKVWAACLSVVATYTQSEHYWASVVWIIVIFTVTGFASNTCWVWLGNRSRAWLSTPQKRRFFNYSLSGLTFATVLPMILR